VLLGMFVPEESAKPYVISVVTAVYPSTTILHLLGAVSCVAQTARVNAGTGLYHLF